MAQIIFKGVLMEHNGHDKLNGILRGFLGDSFTLDEKEAIDVAYLCVKETSSRVQERESY